MLSLNPSGKGVCSNFIHLSSVSNRLMFLKNFHHMRFSPLVELKSPNQLIMISDLRFRDSESVSTSKSGILEILPSW